MTVIVIKLYVFRVESADTRSSCSATLGEDETIELENMITPLEIIASCSAYVEFVDWRMSGLPIAYRYVEWFCIILAGFQSYIGHHMYLEMLSFNQLDMHSLSSASRLILSETEPKFCVRNVLLCALWETLTPSLRKSKRQYCLKKYCIVLILA